MLYRISDGTVTLGGETVLSHIDFEIKGNERVAVVGKNGSGKTTLLRLMAGELVLDRDDKRQGPGIFKSRDLTVGFFRQQEAAGGRETVEQALLAACPDKDPFSRERYEYETEYDKLFTGFGFSRADKKKRLEEFSGGERAKIAMIRLLLERPDILLLDEPTNHLDVSTLEWLERYLKSYGRAVVMVSHDRFFLDRTAEAVWELENGRLTRYAGNYTDYRAERERRAARELAAYKRQQEEIKRQEELISRFKNKPRKAAFARSRKKMLDRMERLKKPEEGQRLMRPGEIVPEIMGSKWVFEAEHLKLGYEKPMLELSLRIRRGQRIGVIGANGAGKSTFLKTVAGLIPPLDGRMQVGNQITMGYFDQMTAALQSESTVLEHFHGLFPSMTEKEVRTALGAYLFGGRDVMKSVSSLSGGEKSRLLLAELIQSRPNFLVLDEPTNHMDIQAKEVLEAFFKAYRGTLLFISHDRYLVDQAAESLLIFENGSAMYYPFGYSHYLERREREDEGEPLAARIRAEEQALIAGLKAVPKAERRRLKEISTEDAYRDWKLRLAGERLDEAAGEARRLESEIGDLRAAWESSEEFWKCVSGDGAQGEFWDALNYLDPRTPQALREFLSRLGELEDRLRLAGEEYLSRCLEWYEIYEGEP